MLAQRISFTAILALLAACETPTQDSATPMSDETAVTSGTETASARPKDIAVNLDSYLVASSQPATVTKWRDKPILTPAKLTFPSSNDATGRYPAIVYLLTVGGLHDDDKRWQRKFRDEGYAVLQIDQYSNRGLSLSSGMGKAQLGISDMSYLSDVYAGIKYLKQNDWIDPERIAIFGRSWGGGMQVYMTSDWYQSRVGEGLEIEVRVALYPICSMTVEQPVATSGKTLFVLGGKDTWNAPAPCVDYASRLKSAGGDITVEILPNAVHSWDNGYSVETKRGVTVWGRCHNLWNPSTMETWAAGSSERHDMSDGSWGQIWDDCVVKSSVKTGGTPGQIAKTEEIVFGYLRNHL